MIPSKYLTCGLLGLVIQNTNYLSKWPNAIVHLDLVILTSCLTLQSSGMIGSTRPSRTRTKGRRPLWPEAEKTHAPQPMDHNVAAWRMLARSQTMASVVWTRGTSENNGISDLVQQNSQTTHYANRLDWRHSQNKTTV